MCTMQYNIMNKRTLLISLNVIRKMTKFLFIFISKSTFDRSRLDLKFYDYWFYML